VGFAEVVVVLVAVVAVDRIVTRWTTIPVEERSAATMNTPRMVLVLVDLLVAARMIVAVGRRVISVTMIAVEEVAGASVVGVAVSEGGAVGLVEAVVTTGAIDSRLTAKRRTTSKWWLACVGHETKG
jgi:hypothetical protein